MSVVRYLQIEAHGMPNCDYCCGSQNIHDRIITMLATTDSAHSILSDHGSTPDEDGEMWINAGLTHWAVARVVATIPVSCC